MTNEKNEEETPAEIAPVEMLPVPVLPLPEARPVEPVFIPPPAQKTEKTEFEEIKDVYAELQELSVIERMRFIAPFIFNPTIWRGLFMKDWKTTIIGVVRAVIVGLAVFNINIPDTHQETIVQSIGVIYALIEVVHGWFQKDKDKPSSTPQVTA